MGTGVGRDWVSKRREETTISCQECDCDLWHSSDFMHQARQSEVQILVHGIELLWDVEGDNCDLALDLEGNFVRWGHNCGGLISSQLSVGNVFSRCIGVERS